MAFPTTGGNAQWILELDIADDKKNPKGTKQISFELVAVSSEATAVIAADALIDAIEAISPLGAIAAARLVKPIVAVDTPAQETNNQERILVTLTTAEGDSTYAILAPAKTTAGGTLVDNDGILQATNAQYVALVNLLRGGVWLAPNGSVPTGVRGGKYEFKPGKYYTGSNYN